MTGTTDRDYLKTNHLLPGLPSAPERDVQRQYLVTLSGTIDDIPVGVFNAHTEAIKFMSENPAYGNVGVERDRNPSSILAAFAIANRDISCVLGYDLWTFENGVPVAKELFYWDDNPFGWPED